MPGRPTSEETGITLVELLIVVSILAILASIGVPKYLLALETSRKTKVVQDLRTISFEIDHWFVTHKELPETLPLRFDPWGNPYQYTNFDVLKQQKGSGIGQMRKNRFQVPINSDYDLWSMGPDGQSQMPLTAKVSRDDIIRANDGRYIGPVSEY